MTTHPNPLSPVIGAEYLINHPDLHRRANPVSAVVVGPDPHNNGHWIVAVSHIRTLVSPLLSIDSSDIGDPTDNDPPESLPDALRRIGQGGLLSPTERATLIELEGYTASPKGYT